jgi:hypothetical protein
MKKVLFFALTVLSTLTQAQIYPHADGFETYTDYTTLGMQGGYVSDMTVEPAHGVGPSKGVVAKMDNVTSVATLITPLIGLMTSTSVLTLQYRVVGLNSYPNIPVVLGPGDKIEIFGQGAQSSNWYSLKVIDETNHMPGSSFNEIKLPLAVAAGNSVYFKVVVTKASSTGFFADFDLLAVEDGNPSNVVFDIKPTSVDPTCFAGTNGSISLVINGGTPPYTYIWYPALPNSANVSGLPAGTYYVTVADSNDNTATETIILAEPAPMVLSTTPVHLICNGADHGSIDLTVQNAQGAVSFIWSNLSQTEDVSNLTANMYFVTVTDAMNCTAVTSEAVTEPAAFDVTETHTYVSAPTASDATITLTVAGATPSYTYSINGTNYTPSEVFTGLAVGCYDVTIKDSRNCMHTVQNICVTEAPVVNGISNLKDVQVSVYPNPAASYVEVKATDMNGAKISIINSLGEVVRRTTQASGVERVDISDLAQGNYVVNLTSEKGSVKKTISIVR